jgi:GNAT superfamily N-acetyltransferase
VSDRSEPVFVFEPADSPASIAIQEAFFADIASRYPGWSPAASQSVDHSELAPPAGAWIVAYVDDHAVGCGGLQALDRDTAEIRRIFLAESARGHGTGRALLAELERRARELGYRRLRLTTGEHQAEALGLFRSAGYAEVPRFTDGEFTTHWMEKALA